MGAGRLDDEVPRLGVGLGSGRFGGLPLPLPGLYLDLAFVAWELAILAERSLDIPLSRNAS